MCSPPSNLSKRIAVLASLVLCVAACASSPVADEKIAVAKTAVQRAEQSGAPQAAPVELGMARDKLARAEKANADRNLKPATELAEQARRTDGNVPRSAAAHCMRRHFRSGISV